MPIQRFFPDFGATIFFTYFLPKLRESPREFPDFFLNSQKFMGITGISQEFTNFQKKKIECHRHNLFIFRAMVTYNFFLPYNMCENPNFIEGGLN